MIIYPLICVLFLDHLHPSFLTDKLSRQYIKAGFNNNLFGFSNLSKTLIINPQTP